MQQDSLSPSTPNAGNLSGKKIGWMAKCGLLLKRFTYDLLVAHFPSVLIGLASVFGLYGWQVQEGNVPSPRELLGSPSPTSQPVRPPRPEGIVSVDVQAGNSPADRLAGKLHLDVVRKIASVSVALEGSEIVYGLQNLRVDGGRTEVDLAWAIQMPNSDWHSCPSTTIVYGNDAILAERIAGRINNSLSATSSAGRVKCS